MHAVERVGEEEVGLLVDVGRLQRVDLEQEVAQEVGLSLGCRVAHPTFGEGVVLEVEGQGARARVQVNFDEVGSKWLMLSHVKLERLD